MLHRNENKRKVVQAEMFAAQNDPRPSNRGVINPFNLRVWSHLDYFAATYPEPVKARRGQQLDHWAGNDLLVMERQTRGITNWLHGAELFPAGWLFWNDGASEHGSYLVLSGADLSMCRQWHHMTDDELLARITRNASTVSRLDFAINVEGGAPSDCLDAFNSGDAKTRVQSVREVKGHGKAKGHTVYFGSTSSKKMLRVYDKAAELKELFSVLTRIELQARKNVATRLSKAMIANSVHDAGKTAVRTFCDFTGIDWYQQAVQSDTVEMSLSPAKETSFENWLMQQVLPAIEKRKLAGVELDAIAKFSDALHDVLKPDTE